MFYSPAQLLLLIVTALFEQLCVYSDTLTVLALHDLTIELYSIEVL